MRHGYYVPWLGEEFGDPEFSASSRLLWDRYAEACGRDWKELPPSRVDGISIYTVGATIVRRRVVQDTVPNDQGQLLTSVEDF